MTSGAPIKFPRLAAATLLLASFLTGCAQPAAQTTPKYMFWPPAPDTPHIEFLTTISSTGDVTGSQEKMDSILYGKQQTVDLPFARPFGLRMYNGCIYVCDASSGTVSILDLRKKEVRILGQSSQITLLTPLDIAVASDGAKYVADTGHGAVVVFDANDKYAGRIKVEHLRPISVAVQGNELYVADALASRIRVFDRLNGNELRTIGERGGGKGQLGGVMGIALDAQGNLFANDFIGCRVQKFTPDGKVAYSIGGLGDRPGSFVRPKLMTVDSDGILYVVDNAFQNVQMFNDKGQFLMFFGSAGAHPGAMNMPAGIFTSDQDLDLFQQYVHPAFQLQRIILVSNQTGNAKINVYGLGVLKPGKNLADISAGRVQGAFGFDTRPNVNSAPTTLPAEDASTTQPTTTQPLTQPATQPATQPPAAPAIQPTTKPKPEENQKPF